MTAVPDSPRAPRFSLRVKLGFLAAALTLLPIPLVGFVLMQEAHEGLESQAKAFQLALAGDVAGSLQSQLQDAEDALDTVGRLLMSETLPEEHAITASLRTIEGVSALDHVVIYDSEGGLVDVVRETGAPDPQPPEQLDRELREEAARRGAALGSPTSGDIAARLAVVVPLRPAPGEPPSAFAASSVSLEPLQEYVERLASERFEDSARSLFVLDANARIVASADGMAGEDVVRLERHPLLEGIRNAEWESGFAQQRAYTFENQEYLGTLTNVPQRRWGILVQVPTAVAYRSIRTMQTVVLGTAGAITILALLLGLWMARSVTRPIRALMDLGARLGRRELGATVEVTTSDELRTLGDVLSKASVDLAQSEQRIRKEEAIRTDLGRYLPGEIVERVVQREQDMGLGGTRREITVLFADVVNFTPMTEEHDPELVVSILNELFTFLTEIVFRHGGTVDKFIGDCVMAIWNAPADQENHAELAVTAAEDMLRWLESGNERWRQQYGVKVQLAIGIHTGEAIVGNVGSQTRMTYTAIGDVVNVAARLEAIARPQQILVTNATKQAAGEFFQYVDAGERELAGRRDTVHLFEVRT